MISSRVIGGFGAQLIHALTQTGVALKARSLGVNDDFGRSAYEAIDLYKLHHLDAASIVRAARELVG